MQMNRRSFLETLAGAAAVTGAGAAFGAGGDRFVRLSYATSMDKLRIAVERIGRMVAAMRH